MPDRLPDINLLPTYDRRGEGSPIIFLLFLGITLLAFIVMGAFHFIYKNDLSALEDEYEHLVAEEEALQEELYALDVVEKESHRGSVLFLENHQIETSRFIMTLTDLLPENSYLYDYTYFMNEAEITVHLEAYKTLATYTKELVNSDDLKDTKLMNVRKVVQEGEQSEQSYYEAEYQLDVQQEMLKKETSDDE